MNKKRPPMNFKAFGKTVKTLIECYPKLVPLTALLIIFSSAVSAIPALFMQKIIAVITEWTSTGNWEAASVEIVPKIVLLGCFYLVSIISVIAYSQLTAYITQGYLSHMRKKMFSGMQDLPIRYFDTHKHGEIMSRYTNDIDTLRELVSSSLPTLIQSGITVLTAFIIMLYFSVWLALVVVVGILLMMFAVKKLGGGSSKYFMRQQKSTGEVEGYIQEMMNGQKVVKVFNHEEEGKQRFDEVNGRLYSDSRKAHSYANVLMPLMMNTGNVLYVIVALVGGILLATGAPNLSLSGKVMSISIVVPFLSMTKQFSGNLSMISQQINSVAMGIAGANRVFELIEEEPEEDNGKVSLVNAEILPDGTLAETDRRTAHWAWKRVLDDGSVELIPLAGDVRMKNVTFSYEKGKTVLSDITLYAKPGQKVAFVGATGAGKTTITNLINRYYDIENGEITYDGINITDISKKDLRSSLGMVLQDTTLFTGTVMDNIRYGRLEATDEECIEAAKLAGADDFIRRLPDGYNTVLYANGANLSQGQRQLISIARCAVNDPPVMILDEATSSIDTHTEAIVQRGMDKLMEGRTVFVIAHRLSTVMNSNVIMVLDHGKIIERGDHDELIAAKGIYYRLYTGAFELE